MANEKDFRFNNIGGTLVGASTNLVKIQILREVLDKKNAITLDAIPDDISPLGTPIYDSVTFGSTTNKGSNNYLDIQGNKVSYNPLKLIEVLVDVSMTRNIVSTSIQGKNGTIKQYISDGDYSILITGTISGKYDSDFDQWESVKVVSNNYFPEQELKTLIFICKAGYQIPIYSKFLNEIFGINHVVITDYRFPQIEGGRNNQSFEINCMSDKNNILEFTQEQVEDSEQLINILNS